MNQQRRQQMYDFARNGRWGTCGECPLDGLGNALPELCEHTCRADHALTLRQLLDAYENDLQKARRAELEKAVRNYVMEHGAKRVASLIEVRLKVALLQDNRDAIGHAIADLVIDCLGRYC